MTILHARFKLRKYSQNLLDFPSGICYNIKADDVKKHLKLLYARVLESADRHV